mmetsp:Transcript_5169/g.15544  ORF Transcript_5169/g.15544 Transcript_5169/m.15544 type:complete len:235 (+) Transcript_5169:626-1330(+)
MKASGFLWTRTQPSAGTRIFPRVPGWRAPQVPRRTTAIGPEEKQHKESRSQGSRTRFIAPVLLLLLRRRRRRKPKLTIDHGSGLSDHKVHVGQPHQRRDYRDRGVRVPHDPRGHAEPPGRHHVEDRVAVREGLEELRQELSPRGVAHGQDPVAHFPLPTSQVEGPPLHVQRKVRVLHLPLLRSKAAPAHQPRPRPRRPPRHQRPHRPRPRCPLHLNYSLHSPSPLGSRAHQHPN